MSNEAFIPHVEGRLAKSCRQPIFARIFTHQIRSVNFDPRLLTREGGLRRIGELIAEHHRWYVERSETMAECFEVAYYSLFITEDRAIRYSLDGEVLGEFEDTPANPTFSIGGRSFSVRQNSA